MGLFRRGKVWWMDFMFHGTRVRRSTDTSDKKLAGAILGKVKAQIVEGKFFDKLEEQDRTFGEMMERYLTERSILKAPKSRLRDKSVFQHLVPIFGEQFLTDVTAKNLAAYRSHRRTEGAATATINKELQLVRHAFNLAMREWEWCGTNPMHRISLEAAHNQVDRWLTAEEEARLFDASPAWLREIISFALNTGMRQGEILALQWKDVDFFRGTLVVMKSKNRERRTIPLNNAVFALLAEKKAAGANANDDPVFLTGKRNPLKVRYLVHTFTKARERASLKDFRFHDLRHTFASRLVQRGIDLYKVQRLLGHKSGLMTQRYAHHCPESLRDGVRVLEPSLAVDTNLTQSKSNQGNEVCKALK
jgi:integrase